MQFAVDLLYLLRSGSGIANFSVLDLNYTGDGYCTIEGEFEITEGKFYVPKSRCLNDKNIMNSCF